MLLSDLDHDLKNVQGRSIVSIFIGGGTPSLISAEGIHFLLTQIRDRIEWHPAIEITLEANPGSVDSKNFTGYHDVGINRLSMGVQSFNNKHLRKLGRIHSSQTAVDAIQIAKTAGFKNFNIDLMFGLPDQTNPAGLEDLQQAITLSPTHLSWYQLTLEPHTPFFKNPPRLPQHDAIVDLYEAGLDYLQRHHFKHYEVSAFSRPGFECQHNLNYWQFGDYIGIGAGAHSKVTQLATQQIERYWKKPHPKAYLNAIDGFIGGSDTLQVDQLPFEFMLNALRTEHVITRELFEKRTGLAWSILIPALEKGSQKGLLEWDAQSIVSTPLGKRFYNDMVGLFL